MIQSFKEMLVTWSAAHGERSKLQHAYVVVSIVGIILAGLVGLLNRDLSQVIVSISLASLAIWLANVLVWALLYSLVVIKLPKKQSVNKHSRP
ncbi:MAG TPA: hypothetical protein VM581_02775 [Magnetospirillaceae bacterium]|nr:hypothetical protein [Magnetospirillaceae bacterium]